MIDLDESIALSGEFIGIGALEGGELVATFKTDAVDEEEKTGIQLVEESVLREGRILIQGHP